MSPRIGIVGAGPGGLSLARLLTEKGYADITVLERQDTVGGKSRTVFHEGIGHELGTCYVGLGYLTTKRWMAEAGISLYALPGQKIQPISGELQDFKSFVEGDTGLFAKARQGSRYLADWLAFHEWDVRGAPDDTPGTNGQLMREEVAQPFGEWLAARELDLVARFSLRSITVMGYGALENVPAVYGLRWNMPSLIASGALTQIAEPTPGWQPLWAHLANQLDVRTSHTITSVQRDGDGYTVHTDHGALAFDHLVITTPLDEATAWFPFDEAERQAYPIGADVLHWHEFVSTIAEVRGFYRDYDTWCSQERVKDAAALAGGYLIGARRTGDKSAVAKVRSATRKDIYVLYQYGDPARSDQEQLALLESELAARGATLGVVLQQGRWKYSPQLTSQAIAGGALGRMESHQGTRNLWLSGATMSHETVDNIVDYNERLVERMLRAFHGQPPSDAEAFDAVAEKFQFSLSDK